MIVLSLLLSFTMMVQTKEIVQELRTPEKVVREIKTYEEMPEVIIPQEAEQPASHYYGSCRITFYCPCSSCCGSWGNATASGVMPTAGRTVANGSLPFGTRVMIDGVEYVVEDRGVGGDQFDIFVNDHAEALARGMYQTEVYIIE